MQRESQVLFCPFCRECFEGLSRCPEHELSLVTFDRLGPDPEDPELDPAHLDLQPVSAFELRYGRGLIAAGALINLLGLPLTMVEGAGFSRGLAGYEMAITTPSLWTLLPASVVLLYILRTRRTPVSMRRLRVLVPLVALLSPATVAWAFLRMLAGAPLYAAGARVIGHTPGLAVYSVLVAATLVFVGGIRFGVPPASPSR